MKKVKLQINELNKLYDEVYYTNLDDIESSLEIITGLVAEKELEDLNEDIDDLTDVIEAIISVLDDVADAFDSEGLDDSYEFVKDKIDKIQSGDMDDIIEMQYLRDSDDDMDDDLLEDEDYDDVDGDYDEDDMDDSDYDEY